MKDNPRRPPKLWMRHCVQGASRSSRDPGAVCGSLWYHKMSAKQRRAALSREGKRLEENMRRVSTWEGPVEVDHSPNGALVFYLPPRTHGKGGAFSPSEARRLGEALVDEARAAERAKNTQTVRRTVVRENPNTGLWVVGALALAGAAAYFLSKNKTSSAATATGPLPPPPAPLPSGGPCNISLSTGYDFAKSKGYSLTWKSDQPASGWAPPDASFLNDPSARAFSGADCGFFRWTGSSWASDDATNGELLSYVNTHGLSGHPANMFMVF